MPLAQVIRFDDARRLAAHGARLKSNRPASFCNSRRPGAPRRRPRRWFPRTTIGPPVADAIRADQRPGARHAHNSKSQQSPPTARRSHRRPACSSAHARPATHKTTCPWRARLIFADDAPGLPPPVSRKIVTVEPNCTLPLPSAAGIGARSSARGPVTQIAPHTRERRAVAGAARERAPHAGPRVLHPFAQGLRPSPDGMVGDRSVGKLKSFRAVGF